MSEAEQAYLDPGSLDEKQFAADPEAFAIVFESGHRPDFVKGASGSRSRDCHAADVSDSYDPSSGYKLRGR